MIIYSVVATQNIVLALAESFIVIDLDFFKPFLNSFPLSSDKPLVNGGLIRKSHHLTPKSMATFSHSGAR